MTLLVIICVVISVFLRSVTGAVIIVTKNPQGIGFVIFYEFYDQPYCARNLLFCILVSFIIKYANKCPNYMYIRKLVSLHNSVDCNWSIFFDIRCVMIHVKWYRVYKQNCISFCYCVQSWRHTFKIQPFPHVHDVIMFYWI